MAVKWHLKLLSLSSLTAWYKNPRQLSQSQYDQLQTSLDTFGLIDKPIVNADSENTVIGGHQRLRILHDRGIREVECWVPERELSIEEVEELNIRLNRNLGAWDWDVLANEFEVDDLLEWGFSEIELGLDALADDVSLDDDDDQGTSIDGLSTFGEDRMLGPYLLGPNDEVECGIFVGDMMELADAIPDESVDLVFSDPPYDEASVSLYGALARIADCVLKPGGLCAVYVGKMYLGRILADMLDYLDYWWMCAIYQPGGGRYVYPRQLAEAWRSILVMRKGGSRGSGSDENDLPRWVRDAYQGQGREKDVHKWQQEVLPPAKYISAWTNEGDVVLDPFCGGGTFPAVCKALNRYYLSFDIDEEAVISARKRVKRTGYDLVTDMSLDDDITPVDGASDYGLADDDNRLDLIDFS